MSVSDQVKFEHANYRADATETKSSLSDDELNEPCWLTLKCKRLHATKTRTGNYKIQNLPLLNDVSFSSFNSSMANVWA